MTSDERLVAKIAKELLRGNGTLTARFPEGTDATRQAWTQLGIADESDIELKLPALVITATLQDSVDSALARQYVLKVEERSLPKQPDATTADDTFALVQQVFVPAVAPARPASLNTASYFRIDRQTGSGFTLGEVISRDRSWEVFAKLV